MKEILINIIVVYCLGIAPYLLGHLIKCVSNKKGGNPGDTYVKGYVAYFAAFGLLSYTFYNHIWKSEKNWDVEEISNVWRVFVFGVGALFVILIATSKKLRVQVLDDVKGFYKLVKNNPIFAIFVVASITFSVLFLKPMEQDTVPEYVNFSEMTGEVFSVDQTTGTEIVYTPVNYPLIHLFYNMVIRISNCGGIYMIHGFSPVFLLLFFYAVYAELGRRIFRDSIKKQQYFFIFAVLAYAVQPFMNSYIGLAVYRNIWNGTTLAVSCLLPLLFAHGLEIMRMIKEIREKKENKDIKNYIGIVLYTTALLLAVQLAIPSGATVGFGTVLLACAIA